MDLFKKVTQSIAFPALAESGEEKEAKNDMCNIESSKDDIRYVVDDVPQSSSCAISLIENNPSFSFHPEATTQTLAGLQISETITR
jgi:dGTP triphosphohydrolase